MLRSRLNSYALEYLSPTKHLRHIIFMPSRVPRCIGAWTILNVAERSEESLGHYGILRPDESSHHFLMRPSRDAES